MVSGVVALSFTIACGYFVRRDAWPLVLGAFIAPAIQLAFNGTPSPRELLRPSEVDWATARRWLRVGMPGLVTMPAYWVLTASDRWFLVGISGTKAAGVYSIAFNVAMMGQMINSAIVLVWYPEVSRLVASKSVTPQAVILLDFWATWCGGCKLEIPWYVEFQNKYRDAGLSACGTPEIRWWPTPRN